MAKRPSKRPAKKPQGPDSRWITVRKSFDYRWSHASVTHFSQADLGEHRVKNEVADFAVKNGYATEGKLGEQTTAKTADTGTVQAVDHKDAADADRPADRPPVDSDAG